MEFSKIFLIVVLVSILEWKLAVGSSLEIREEGEESVGISQDFACGRPNFNQCAANKDSKTKFILYTKYHKEGYELKVGDAGNLKKSNFLKGKNVKVIIHGFVAKPFFEFPKGTKDAYLTVAEDLNVIVVDWSTAGSLMNGYTRAAECTKLVSSRVAALLKFLVTEKLTSFSKIHLVGHSLGAQISGMVGQELGGAIQRITGLDPARPCFELGQPGHGYRLSRTQAVFVDVIHTDGEDGPKFSLGLSSQLGHVDFYPNSGRRDQPGCWSGINSFDACSHMRAPQLFTDSITHPASFVGRQCENSGKFNNGECNGRSLRVMGEFCPSSSLEATPFFLRTKAAAPFGLGHPEASV